ncbi:MAG: hypothetical protein JNL60_17395 [Bacteroidia bacterium]|nr:hypothetical protein [Bacteroidia bacterium]
MENDTKDLLMQYLDRISSHYELQGAGNTSFKKRSVLLDQLKAKDPEAWRVMDELFNAFIKADRILNDKEKFDKARVLWEAERASSEKDKVTAEMHLVQHFKQLGITVGSLSQSLT